MAYKDTGVAVERSQGHIRDTLKRHGARRFAFGEDLEEDGVAYALIRFEHQGVGVRMRVPFKMPDEDAIGRRVKLGRPKRSRAQVVERAEQDEARRIWRVIHYNLKARMESVEEGVETFVEAFMAHVINPSTGQTVYEELAGSGRVELPGPLPQAALPAGTR